MRAAQSAAYCLIKMGATWFFEEISEFLRKADRDVYRNDARHTPFM